MASQDEDDGINNELPDSNDPNNSFVEKVKSFLPLTISNWLKRDKLKNRRRSFESESETSTNDQPPSKRFKTPLNYTLPTTDYYKSLNNYARPSTHNATDITKNFNSYSSSSSTYRYSDNSRNGNKLDSDFSEKSSAVTLDTKKYTNVETSPKITKNVEQGTSKKIKTVIDGNRKYEDDNVSGLTSRSQSIRSLFSDDIGLRPNSSLSTRQPSFNSMYAVDLAPISTPSSIKSDITLTTNRAALMKSPFYAGRTMFGGASSAGGNRSVLRRRDQTFGFLEKNSINIRPVNNNNQTDGTSSMTQTARRILNTLEQFSHKVTNSDINRIPRINLSTSSGDKSKETTNISINPYARLHNKKYAVKELVVPSVADLLEMKRKEKFQNVTESVREIATSNLTNTYEYKLPDETKESCKKYSNKIKTKITKLREKPKEIEQLSANDTFKLPNVSLPPMSNLPKFDITMPKSNDTIEITKKSSTTLPQTNSFEFKIDKSKKLSSPSPLQDNKKSSSIENKFSLSENKKLLFNLSENQLLNPPGNNNLSSSPENKLPNASENSSLSENKTSSWIENNKQSSSLETKLTNSPEIKQLTSWTENKLSNSSASKQHLNDPNNKFKFSQPIIMSNSNNISSSLINVNKYKFSDPIKINEEKIIKKPKLIETDVEIDNEQIQIWECKICLGKNKFDVNKCALCQSLRETIKNDKLLVGENKKRQCKICLNYMNDKDSECLACRNAQKIDQKLSTTTMTTINRIDEELREKTWKCLVCLIENKIEQTKCQVCNALRPNSTNSFNLMDKFKRPNDTWQCDVCLIRNQNSLDKCAACSNPKEKESTAKMPTSNILDQFKSTNKETWECSSCLVRNKNDVVACVACTTPKPGLDKTVVPMKNDTPKQNDTLMEKFVKKTNEWECNSCMVRNKETALKCVCCETPKPGVVPANQIDSPKVPQSSSNSFSFGIPVAAKNESSLNTSKFSFGVPAKSPEKTKPLENLWATKPTQSSFTFGVPKINETPKKSDGFDVADAKNASTTSPNKQESISSDPTTPDSSKNNFLFSNPTISTNSNTLAKFNSPVNVTGSVITTPSTNTFSSSFKMNSEAVTSPIIFGINRESETNTKTNTFKSSPMNIFGSETPKSFTFGSTTKKLSDGENQQTIFGSTINVDKKSVDNKKESEENVGNIFGTSTKTNNENKPFSSPSSTFVFGGKSPMANNSMISSKETFNNNSNSASTIFNTVKTETPSSFTSTTQSNLFSFGSKSPPLNATVNVTENKTPVKFSFGADTQTTNLFGNVNNVNSSLTNCATTTTNQFKTNESNNLFEFKPFSTVPKTNEPPSSFNNSTLKPNEPTSFSNTFGGNQNQNSFGLNMFEQQKSTSAATTINPTFNSLGSNKFGQTDNNSGGGFNFTNPKTDTLTKFSTTSPASSSSGFNFNANMFMSQYNNNTTPQLFNSNPTPPFTFGSGFSSNKPAVAAAVPPSAGFNANLQTKTDAPVFQFGATNDSNKVPQFDPTAKPMFNFTSGEQNLQFTAQPVLGASTPIPKRQIKKAFRRRC